MVATPDYLADYQACPKHPTRMHRRGQRCRECEKTGAGAVETSPQAVAGRAITSPQAAPAPSKPKPKPGEVSEDALCAALDSAGLKGYQRQYPFAKALGRRYQADVAYLSERLLVEVDGQVHSIKDKRERDCARDSIAAILGWRIVRATPKQVREGLAADWVRAALGRAGEG